jgi:hypothetical protein
LIKALLMIAAFGGALVIAPAPPVVSLCDKGEKVIFSCTIKQPAKIVSLCASADFAKDRGYLQYRFGLPRKIELEFPRTRENTQAAFKYSHYFRAQFDQTEISFTSGRSSVRHLRRLQRRTKTRPPRSGDQNHSARRQRDDLKLPWWRAG